MKQVPKVGSYIEFDGNPLEIEKLKNGRTGAPPLHDGEYPDSRDEGSCG